VLLHGLAGYAEEWSGTASWLSQSHRVVAPEQRGHGRSEREPADVSRDAFVRDVETWADELELAPAVVVGQSLGGHTAFLLAAKRPELVRGLVVAEATPQADPDAPAHVRQWLEAWPVPFASRAAAVSYFGGDTAWAQAWVDGLERREEGLWPSFETDVMVAALDETSRTSYWNEWARIRCPVFIVRAAGTDPTGSYGRMVESLPTARLIEVEDAGHDLHLDQPQRWREVLEEFLATLDR
jgi:pimeloyl-ACP methyl ester carboxylesterase